MGFSSCKWMALLLNKLPSVLYVFISDCWLLQQVGQELINSYIIISTRPDKKKTGACTPSYHHIWDVFWFLPLLLFWISVFIRAPKPVESRSDPCAPSAPKSLQYHGGVWAAGGTADEHADKKSVSFCQLCSMQIPNNGAAVTLIHTSACLYHAISFSWERNGCIKMRLGVRIYRCMRDIAPKIQAGTVDVWDIMTVAGAFCYWAQSSSDMLD